MPWHPSSAPRRLGRRGGTQRAQERGSSGWAGLESPVRFVRFPVQELALISDYWLHSFPFVDVKPSCSSSSFVLLLDLSDALRPDWQKSRTRTTTKDEDDFEMADGVGIAPTRAEAPLGFQDRGITALPTIRSDLRLQIADLRGCCAIDTSSNRQS